ncbi:hypothetical protein P2318_13275 [Myxococcaceae bacterium GXIMD 01537]
MNSSETRRWLGAVAWACVLCAACTRGPGTEHDPRPQRVIPAEGLGTEPQSIVIEGENFLALATQHLGGGEPVEVHTRFEARLGDLLLEDVVLEDDRHLRARVPPGLAQGPHALSLISPLGRGAVLPDAYRVVSFQGAAYLTATLEAPSAVGMGTSFRVTLTVRNTGETDAVDLTADALVCEGSAGVSVMSGPPASAVMVPVGGTASFSWTLSASGPGTYRCTGSARGRDARDSRSLVAGPITSAQGTVSEVAQLAVDPFRDGTAFSFVVSHGGRLVLGPNRTGRGGARMMPDGSASETFTWTFPADTVGHISTNQSPPPYFSIGASGCLYDTEACGPDDEDGRGLLFAGVLGGQEWLGLSGARSGGGLDYIYLTRDVGPRLDFRYVDLSLAPGGRTHTTSSAFFLGDRLYLGFADSGLNRPGLVALKQVPTQPPGLDAVVPSDAEGLDADSLPGVGESGFPSNPAPVLMVDSMVAFNDRLYLANNGGCVRATSPTPRDAWTSPSDWAPCTPRLPSWFAHVSATTLKTSGLEPGDKAVPRLVVFGPWLYLARNTPEGPQLFVCRPNTSGDSAHCEPDDWFLVAPNTRAGMDGTLTQFDNPANTALTLLAATPRHLVLGFNNSREGIVLMRSEGSNPANTADFRGGAACVASQHPEVCAGLGGNGLGVGATRIFDGEALSFDGQVSVYLTAGDGSGPVRVFRLAD